MRPRQPGLPSGLKVGLGEGGGRQAGRFQARGLSAFLICSFWNGQNLVRPRGQPALLQIPYDLTFNWNIINRKKKRKQNITRDIEVKNNLTMDSGEWGGDSEERGLQEL